MSEFSRLKAQKDAIVDKEKKRIVDAALKSREKISAEDLDEMLNAVTTFDTPKRRTIKNLLVNAGLVTEPHDVPVTVGLIDNQNKKLYKQRVLIGTPMTGLVRAEWVNARYNVGIPTNWSQVEMLQFIHSHIPLRFQVADAENIIAKMAIEGQYEWLLSIEHDNVIPRDAFMKVNEYMIDRNVPWVSGLYFTKSDPPEPLVYKEFGEGCFHDWKLGDKVWVKGTGFGFCLIHCSLLKVLWDESPEYIIEIGNGGKVLTRRIYQAPNEQWFDLDLGIMKSVAGTSDLRLCERIIKDKIFEKAGWSEYAKKEYPYLIDTTIFTGHIDERGFNFPLGGIPKRYLKEETK